jgi:ribosomal protein S12 methylthiotransferase accessory factor
VRGLRETAAVTDEFDDAYTGILTRLSPIPRPAPDPELHLWGGELPPWGPRLHGLSLGGAGWDAETARDACIGEAIERLQAYALPGDGVIDARLSEWPLEEPAIGPERWTLFHPDQHCLPGFPFVPFTREQRCRWVCFRDAATGSPQWIPEELGYLFHGVAAGSRIAPSYSTGLSAGKAGHPVLLRGLQEVIERDAMIGAWWGSYPLEEWAQDDVLRELDPSMPPRFLRPHRRYRFYRVRSPFSDHATIVTVEGEDHGGFLFAVGSACRETRAPSWAKSLLEALQGAAYVRQLRSDRAGLDWADDLSDFTHHAAYYAAHPERLKETALHRAVAPAALIAGTETLELLRERLGPRRPLLFRIMTPPAIAEEFGPWLALRVVVPGLQPLHGNHRWPHLGGPLWGRPVRDWATMAPHPFP